MKNMLMAGLVFLMAQVSLAALGLPKEKLEARIKPYAERIEEARRLSGTNDFTQDPKVKSLIERSLNKIVEAAKAGNTEAFMKLINNDSGKAVLTEIGRLSSIIGDKAASEADKKSAQKGLDLLALSAKNIELLSKNSAHAKEQQEQITLAVKVSEKIAKFNEYTSETAKTYAKAYETALENGLSARAAMKEASRASKKEVKEDDILACET